ncbi:hypothetical protein [Novosphingobium album (ex Hu et al. 2023)]|uniref:Uncharacterized protein n=1 Tax=Novosphingobium album (ex Hu et al. 2023) TaxID=2930093 RepID=A0ABT0B4C5_9SPHN|nr:hypothetical protein [Novosphingobium album (ex Hu et al. 2023)]MCJ2179669.1 hypothetical protein [Novosphingobium album (ex Hu et al. 2023)]
MIQLVVRSVQQGLDRAELRGIAVSSGGLDLLCGRTDVAFGLGHETGCAVQCGIGLRRAVDLRKSGPAGYGNYHREPEEYAHHDAHLRGNRLAAEPIALSRRHHIRH